MCMESVTCSESSTPQLNASLRSLGIQGWRTHPEIATNLLHIASRDMGLPQRMENLHAPTVPSGPTSGLASTNGIHTSGLTFPQLQAKKDNIEAELRALGSVLESVGRIFAKDKLILIVSSMALI
jgi:hypothetical protein